MGTRPVLRVTHQHLAQLLAYCAVYRSYLWQYVAPSPERNQTMRGIQALQGRFAHAYEQGQADIDLFFTGEEQGTIKQLFTGVTHFYGAAPSSEQRIQQLAALTTLRFLVERTFRQVS